MSVTGRKGIGIPIILLHDAEGSMVTVELKNGSVYRGILEEAQDNMNCTLKECQKVHEDGSESVIEMAFVRGSQIKFIVLPDILSKAPFFNRIKMWRKFKGHAVFGVNTAAAPPPRGQSAAIMNRSNARGRPPIGAGDGNQQRPQQSPYQQQQQHQPPPFGGGYPGMMPRGPQQMPYGRGPPPGGQGFPPRPMGGQGQPPNANAGGYHQPPPQGGGQYGRY